MSCLGTTPTVLSTLEVEQRGDVADPVLHRDVLAVVHVAFGDHRAAFEFLGYLLDDGAEHPAGTAPGGPEVYQDGLTGAQNLIDVRIVYNFCHNIFSF